LLAVSGAFRRIFPITLGITVSVLLTAGSLPGQDAQVAPAKVKPGIVDFDGQVKPILTSKCSTCHSQEKRSGGLSLANYSDVLDGGRSGVVVRPGSSIKSLIMERLTGEMEPRMPFGGKPLSDADLALIRNWIDEGARPNPAAAPAEPKWEATLALTAPAVPISPWPGWSHPVERFVANYMAKNHIPKPELVSDAQFARRAYLDVWGLFPPPNELRRFVNDKFPGKRDKLVARLLADNTKYAEHWISFWNDLLRNDEGVNYYSETASRKSITKWLLASLESNVPYDQFVAKLLNPVSPSDPDGFLIGVNWRGVVSASQTPALQAAQNSAQIFLGINLKCNSCHDSFISRWKLKDAYSLASYFSQDEQLEMYRCDVAQHKYTNASFLYPELNRPIASNSMADRRTSAAVIFTDSRNGRLPRTLANRFWAQLVGRGLVENVDEMDGEPWSPELLDWLSADLVAHNYDMKHLIATIIGSKAYQLAAVANNGQPAKHYVFRGPEIRRITAEQFSDAVASITGDWHVIQAPANERKKEQKTQARTNSAFLKPVLFGGAALGLASRNPRAEAPRATAAKSDSNAPERGVYSREWRTAANSLTRSLGRPIRDQVFSTRDTQATTIQAVELVNGETLTHWLSRGSRRMLGELPPDPRSLFTAQVNRNMTDRGRPLDGFDVDISKSSKLYLIVRDALSTAPDKATPLWVDTVLEGAHGKTPLSALKPMDRSGLREGSGTVTIDGIDDGTRHDTTRVKLSSLLVYDIAGKGFTRLRGAPGFEPMQLAQGENVEAKFFIFDKQPNMDRLVPPLPETPVAPSPPVKTARKAEDRVFQYALGRLPSPAERQIADATLRDPDHPGRVSADGLADLLWAVLMKPEFQLIY
jgi:hypothetical protein